MAIERSEISSLTNHGSHYRCRFRFVFTGGREVNAGPFKVKAKTAAEALMVTKSESILEIVQRSDAEEAVFGGSTTANGEATLKQVKAAWLSRWKNAETPGEAHAITKKISGMFASVVTVGDYAIAFGVSRREAMRLKTKREFLQTNDSDISKYNVVQDGWGV